MKPELLQDKEAFIELPLHIKGEVIDFRAKGNQRGPWLDAKMREQQHSLTGFNVLSVLGGAVVGFGSSPQQTSLLAAAQQQAAAHRKH